ncbi:MAG: ribosome maturation factor RimP [Calditrichae bacterium]|nr:ribosome maturation factor RimP [Calditrichota bacterium]MCB9057383.1 ribosome maturation factor RimP [Calditrichia bacterium]
MNREDQLNKIVSDRCLEMGLYLVDLEIKGDKNNPLFLVFADKEDGITLGECEKLSRAIQDEIDFNDDFPVKYRLDVSSPGLDRPLKEDFQFKKNINKNLDVKISHEDSVKKMVGTLKSFDSDTLSLEDSKGHGFIVQRKDILEAKVKLQW